MADLKNQAEITGELRTLAKQIAFYGLEAVIGAREKLKFLKNKFDVEHPIVVALEDLQQDLDEYFRAKENAQHHLIADLQQQMIEKIQQLHVAASELEQQDISLRIQYSLNNIQSSLCHVSAQLPNQTAIGSV